MIELYTVVVVAAKSWKDIDIWTVALLVEVFHGQVIRVDSFHTLIRLELRFGNVIAL